MLVSKAIKNSKKQSSNERLKQDSQVSSVRVAPLVVLPAMAVVSPHSNRHEVNPALALKLLRDIEQSVLVWQTELRRVVSAIKALHEQGPMVDGWLESSLTSVSKTVKASHSMETTLLRHGDADALMQYVEALESHELGDEPSDVTFLDDEVGCSAGAQYRLCWLDDEGKVQSQICPTEQMAVVSAAIARYQKCKQFLTQQRVLEGRLQGAVDELVNVRNNVQRPG